MTTPTIQNITIVRGDDWGAILTFDQPVAGFAEIYLTVRTEWALLQINDLDAMFSGNIAGGEVAVTGTYTVTIDIPSADTLAWVDDGYVYDVQVVTTLGSKKYTTQRGRINMLQDATRS